MIQFAVFALLVLLYQLDPIESYSVCDDVDIIFLVDKESLIHNSNEISDFIYNVIHHGSSENAGFSMYLYGDDIKAAQEIQLLDTFDTHRKNKSDIMLQHIEQEFLNAVDPSHLLLSSSSSHITSVSLKDVFISATQQQQPIRSDINYHKLTYGQHGIGASDGHNRYFIFDHFNKLINKDNDDDICELLDYLDGAVDESIHFIQGQQFIKLEKMFDGLCDNKYKHLLNFDLFVYLNRTQGEPDFDDNEMNDKDGEYYSGNEYYDESDSSEEDNFITDEFDLDDDQHLWTMDQIYHLTCPALIKLSDSENDDQHIHWTAHNQYIDPETIIKCNIEFNDKDTNELVEQNTSYILVNDHLNDGNTFKAGDHLIADPVIMPRLKELGCSQQMYYIVKVETAETINDGHKISKLWVRMPHHMMDFILYADVDTTRDVEVTKEEIKHSNQRRRFVAEDDLPYKEDGSGVREAIGDVDETDQQDLTNVNVDFEQNSVVDTTKIRESKKFELQKRMNSATKDGDEKLKEEFDLIVGKLSGTITYFLEFKFVAEIQYQFKWKNLFWPDSDTDLEKPFFMVDAVGKWHLKAQTTMEIKAKIDFKIQVGKVTIHLPPIMIGPVPLILTPYMTFDIGFETSEVGLKLEWDCVYEKQIHLGYSWSRKPIFKRSTKGAKGISGNKIGFKQQVSNVLSRLASTASRMVSKVVDKVKGGDMSQHLALLKNQDLTQDWGYIEDTKQAEGNDPQNIEVGTGAEEAKGLKILSTEATAEATEEGSCTRTITFLNDETDPCKAALQISITPSITFGLSVYYAIKIEAIPNVKGTLKIQAAIPKTEVQIGQTKSTCPNDATQVCGKTQGLKALATLKFTFQIELKIKLIAPNFFRLVKEAYRAGRLVKGLKAELAKYVAMINEVKSKMEENFRGIKNAFEEAHDAIAAFRVWYSTKFKTLSGDWTKLLEHIVTIGDKLLKFMVECKKGKDNMGSLKSKLNARVTAAQNFYLKTIALKDRLAAILKNPWAKVDLGFTWKSNENTFYHKAFENCITLDTAFTNLLTECCKNHGGVQGAHENPFINSYPYTDASDYYDNYNKYRKHSSPTVNNNGINNNNNSYYDMIMMMDFFIIFIIAICCIGIICCIFGGVTGLTAYYFTNKLNQESILAAKHNYVNINVNDQHDDDETDIENNNNML